MTNLTWNTYSLSKDKAQCPVCAKWVRLLKHDRLWPHGPANNLCRGSWISRRQPVLLNDGKGGEDA